MPDKIARKRHKKKVLDRWENEGGSLSADQTQPIENVSPNERSSKSGEQQVNDAAQTGKLENR